MEIEARRARSANRGTSLAVNAAPGRENAAATPMVCPRLIRGRRIIVRSSPSANSALTQVRPFRPEPYDARGAVDVIVSEANTGQRDVDTVRLLVHALRGASGEVRGVRFARARLGHAPSVNRHTPIAPARLIG